MSAAASTPWPPHAGGRTGQPVRRNSFPFEAGERFFRPLNKATVVHIMRAAERLAIRSMKARGKGRVKRRHAGELTLQDLHILHALLFKCLDWRTGKCAPTYADLTEETGHARDTISGALLRLGKVGILQRMRRFSVAPGVDGKGPQVHQAPNAYRFDLPNSLRALLGLGAESRPLAADAEDHLRERKRAVNHMSADDSGLGAALDRWGAALSARTRVQKIG